MDQRRSGPHPFSRPPTNQSPHDARFAPIPPPPYILQPTTQRRTDIPHSNDPFLRRRNEHEDKRTSPPVATSPRGYAFPSNTQLTANLFPGASDFANIIAQPRRNSYSATPFGVGGADLYGTRIASGTWIKKSLSPTWPFPFSLLAVAAGVNVCHALFLLIHRLLYLSHCYLH